MNDTEILRLVKIKPFTVNPELSRPTQMHRTTWSPS